MSSHAIRSTLCLYKTCGDYIIGRLVLKEEVPSIISPYHDSWYGGHATIDKTAAKNPQSSFYWLTLFKYVHKYVRVCDCC